MIPWQYFCRRRTRIESHSRLSTFYVSLTSREHPFPADDSTDINIVASFVRKVLLAGCFKGYWRHLIFCRRSLIVAPLSLLSLPSEEIADPFVSGSPEARGGRRGAASIRRMSAQRISWILQRTVLGARRDSGIKHPVSVGTFV